MKALKKISKQKEVPKWEANPDFISEVGPVSNISFKNEKFISTGDGYEACIYVYKYPKHVNQHWLGALANISDAIVVFDISSENPNEIKKNINKSMEEQSSRYNNAKNNMERIDAQQRFNELELMYNEITAMGNVMKLVCCRIFIPAKTLIDVDMASKEILANLEGSGYRGGICLNEGKNDWRAVFLPYRVQQKTLYKKDGQPMLSATFAAGNPFHYTKLDDPYGFYYGTTTTNDGGSVLLDLFRVTQMRMSYNSIIVGKMGSGKSTTLKKMLLDRAIRGDCIRVFDVTGEFRELCEYLGGKVINLDGQSGNIINALQILKTGENDNISYNRHFSKVATIYRYLNPEAPYNEVLVVEKLLRKLYIKWGIVSEAEDIAKEISNMKASEYPIWSDFLALVREELAKIKTAGEENTPEFAIVKNIELVIDNVCDSYGNIFNGHTSIENIFKEQIICLDIKNLGGMKGTIFDAQLFNALALCWDNCVTVGSEMKRQFDKKEIDWRDIKRFLIIIDEAHRVINARKLAGVEQITLFEREARKYFGGIALASQSIRDFVPDNATAEGVDQIKTLFELSTYKFIMQQDSNCKEKLREVFQSEFTESELEQVSKLSKGQVKLSISGDNNIDFDVEVTDKELSLFNGGA